MDDVVAHLQDDVKAAGDVIGPGVYTHSTTTKRT